MQKRKSFLMKLLVVLTVAFCTFAIAISMVGCATDGKDGNSIKSATINDNGELVLTLTDGSIVNAGVVKGEQGEQGEKGDKGDKGDAGAAGANGVTKCTCSEAEADIVTYVARIATCSETGVTVDFCTVCNGFEVKTAEKDADVHGTYTYTAVDGYVSGSDAVVPAYKFTSSVVNDEEGYVAATCTTGGHDKTICTLCNEVVTDEDIPAFGHMGYKTTINGVTKYVGDSTSDTDCYIHLTGAKNNGNVCMDGTFDIFACALCGDVYDAEDVPEGETALHALPKYTDARGYHTADTTWTYVTKPTTTAEGEITGVCTKCNTTQSIVVPALTAENGYTVNVIKTATCTENGETNYQKTIADTFTVNLTVPTSTAHTFNDEAISLDKIYEQSEVEILGLTILGNVPGNCLVPGEAVFVCDDCGKTYKVTFNGKHKHADDDEGEVTDPTCQAMGYTTYTCINEGCGKVYNDDFVAKIPCDWVVQEDLTVENDGGTVNLTFECSMCEATMTLENATLKDSKAADCTQDGYRTYEYANPNFDEELGETEENKAKLTITLEDAQLTTHKMSGKQYNVSATSEYRYSEIEDLIKDDETNPNGPLTWIENEDRSCIIPGEGVFECETCTKTFKIKVYSDHDFGDNEKVIPDAVCTGDQNITQYCNTCEKDVVVETVAAIDHDYQVTNVVENDDDTADITFTCSMCGDSFTIEGATLVADECVAPTCEATGTNVYKYLDPDADENKDEDESNDVYIKKSITVAKSTKHIVNAGQNHEEDGFDVSGSVRYGYSDIQTYVDVGTIDYIENVEVTCVTPGEGVFACATCGKTYKIYVYADHTWGETQIQTVTCEEDGYNYQECTAEGCDAIKIDETTRVTALGHDYKAEVLEDGKVQLDCQRENCDEVKVITPEKVERTKEPTCETVGNDRYYYYETEEDKAADLAAGTAANIMYIDVEVEELGHDYYEFEVTFQLEVAGVLYDCVGQTCTRDNCNYVNIISMTEVVVDAEENV